MPNSAPSTPTRRLAVNRAQFERLLDLYLSGKFFKEVLTDRRALQGKTFLALVRERAGLVAHLDTQLLSPEQIKAIHELAAKVSEKLEALGEDFEKCGIVEALHVQVTLAAEDGQRAICVRRVPGRQVCSLRSVPSVL